MVNLNSDQLDRIKRIRNYAMSQKANATINISREDIEFLLSLFLPPDDQNTWTDVIEKRDPSVDHRVYEGDDQGEIKGY